ncbi:ALMA4 [Symbiodinium pilosum]|uniref:ALMA4 protein n=1 Tax=Symbiodinium pilosum TaxID=2952 RepID=A0A812MFM8_SYMPI|nr:ALMA4 [Symbiodinium pilosum]
MAATLDTTLLQSVRECFERLLSFASNITGVTADFGNLWLKHHSAIRSVIPERPVYLTPIIQLPMISACFKSCEQILLVTWGSQEDVESMKPKFLSDCNIVLDVDRLEILGIDASKDPRWARYLNFETTAEDDQALGAEVLSMVQRKMAEVNVQGKKDMFIKSVIVTTRLSMFSDNLRQGTGLPVFNELTMLDLFSSASSLSHYNDAKVLCRLDEKLAKPTSPTTSSSPRSFKLACKLGLLQLEYNYPPAFGDVDHPGTFGFQTCPRVVGGLTFERAQEGSFDPAILENMAKQIKTLEDDGVVGITGNCGFMMHYQCFARYVANVPVFMSALIQAATMAAAMEPAERVLILTANAASLQPGRDKLLLESGIQVTNSEKFVIRGCESLPGFEAVANAERVDTIRVQAAISSYVLDIIKEEGARDDAGSIKMILLECTELPHYADELRRMTGLPVFDAVTCVNYFFRATATNNWNTKTFTPHNPTFWSQNFDAKGRMRDNCTVTGTCQDELITESG